MNTNCPNGFVRPQFGLDPMRCFDIRRQRSSLYGNIVAVSVLCFALEQQMHALCLATAAACCPLGTDTRLVKFKKGPVLLFCVFLLVLIIFKVDKKTLLFHYCSIVAHCCALLLTVPPHKQKSVASQTSLRNGTAAWG